MQTDPCTETLLTPDAAQLELLPGSWSTASPAGDDRVFASAESPSVPPPRATAQKDPANKTARKTRAAGGKRRRKRKPPNPPAPTALSAGDKLPDLSAVFRPGELEELRLNSRPGLVRSSWKWLARRLRTQQAKKRLRVCETLALGEKRFIAVVEVDDQQFLVGGSSSSVSTLAQLQRPRGFAAVFQKGLAQSANRT